MYVSDGFVEIILLYDWIREEISIIADAIRWNRKQLYTNSELFLVGWVWRRKRAFSSLVAMTMSQCTEIGMGWEGALIIKEVVSYCSFFFIFDLTPHLLYWKWRISYVFMGLTLQNRQHYPPLVCLMNESKPLLVVDREDIVSPFVGSIRGGILSGSKFNFQWQGGIDEYFRCLGYVGY